MEPVEYGMKNQRNKKNWMKDHYGISHETRPIGLSIYGIIKLITYLWNDQ